MQPNTKKLLVLTSGGDAPGMNAAIRAVVRTAYHYNFAPYACYHGYTGLINQEIFPMPPSSVSNCIQRGGTILKTSRSEAFKDQKTRDACREFLQQQGINYLITIGGDGTFRGASLLEMEGGPKAIGIPATIDNDIVGSEYTLGFDTARNTALNAIDHIRDTAVSHDRYFIVEVMGRCTGFLAVDVGLSGGAEFILTPEFPIAIPELAKQIMCERRKKQSMIIVAAEAEKAGRSIAIAEQLTKLTGKTEYRVCILGHIQRGGNPTAFDRAIATQMGYLAVKSLAEGKSNSMIAVQHNQLILTQFPDPTRPHRCLTADDLLKINSIIAM